MEVHWQYLMMSIYQSPNSPQLSPQTTCFPNREIPKKKKMSTFHSFTLYKASVLWPLPTFLIFNSWHSFSYSKAQPHYPLNHLSLSLFCDFTFVLVSASTILSPHNHMAGSFYLNLSSNITPSEKFFSQLPCLKLCHLHSFLAYYPKLLFVWHLLFYEIYLSWFIYHPSRPTMFMIHF